MSSSVLVIEDDLPLLEVIESVLRDDGYAVTTASTGREAGAQFSREVFELVLLDVGLPDADGVELLNRFKAERPQSVIVMMTANAEVKVAVESMRNGAYDFIEKPFRLDRFRTSVRRATDHASGQETVRRMVQQAVASEPFISKSHGIQELLRQVDQVARVGGATTVLIQGETGTGKELIAKRLHALSPRAGSPFFAQSCANFTSTLLEDQLFGHSKGAFTEAHTEQRGLLALAKDGTLFLDEIGEMPLALQAKILRVLEERKFTRLGDHQEGRVEAQIISATNRDLKKMVSSGGFRKDLYYRLGIVLLSIPPLRERRQDILPLLDYYRKLYRAQFGVEIDGFTDAAAELLEQYDWPGNVRELRNLIERLAIIWSGGPLIDFTHVRPYLDSDQIARIDLPPLLVGENGHMAESNPRLVPLRTVQDEHIVSIYRYAQGNKAETARILGITRQTVQKRLAQLDREGRLPALV
ncbi:MAG: hypothetical protein CME06_07335 [Gemmatimonadetes bacterium]|nr:hypothetical protein [Gemmatimonadota bacterium]